MSRPLVGLVMIVRDEAASLRATLDSVKPHVGRHCIVDTGSTDGTHDVVLEATGAEPYNRGFRDFSQARNAALDIADGIPDFAEWSLMLSADETIDGGEALGAFLRTVPERVDALNIEVVSDASFLFPRLTRHKAKWRYEGVVQEMLAHPEGRAAEALPAVPGVRIVHKTTDPERRMRRIREFDRPAIEAALMSPDTPEPWRLRYLSMLGQTREALASVEKPLSRAWYEHLYAALGCYAQRASEKGGDAEEAIFAKFHYLGVADRLEVFLPDESLGRWAMLMKDAPERPEIALMVAVRVAERDAKRGLELAVKAAEVAKKARAKSSRLPVSTSCEWRAWGLASDCAAKIGAAMRAREYVENARAAGAPSEMLR